MKYVTTVCAAAAIVLSAGAAMAGGHDITNQSYKGGKASAATVVSADPLANCPFELRGMYRGTLYCRQPLLALHAPRHPACPEDVFGMYRGSLYCFSGRN